MEKNQRYEIGESLIWRSPHSQRDVEVTFRGWLTHGVTAMVLSATGWHHHAEIAHLRTPGAQADYVWVGTTRYRWQTPQKEV